MPGSLKENGGKTDLNHARSQPFYTKDGQIWLEASEERDALIIDSAQVPTLIEWLQEAVAHLLGAKTQSLNPLSGRHALEPGLGFRRPVSFRQTCLSLRHSRGRDIVGPPPRPEIRPRVCAPRRKGW